LNRFGHAAVVCNNSMFVIGGWNGHDTMDDIYQFSFSKYIKQLIIFFKYQTCGLRSEDSRVCDPNQGIGIQLFHIGKLFSFLAEWTHNNKGSTIFLATRLKQGNGQKLRHWDNLQKRELSIKL